MAKFVIAGRSDCAYFAKAELVADTLARNLPNFRVHKILKSPSEWDSWLNEICSKNKWSHTKSPVVWRECLDRGGKGMLIGDSNDFQEYAKGYYGVYSSLKSSDLKLISEENDYDFKQRQKERQEELSRIKPFNITISYPSSKVAYLILPDILQGHIFGEKKDIFIRLFEKTNNASLNGLKMELEDLASDSLRNVIFTNDPEEAFNQADLIILLDELIEKEEPTVEIKDPIIAEYHNPYIYLAEQVDKYAKDTCKVFITPFESHSRIFGLVQTFISQLKRLNGKYNVIGNSKCDELVAKSILAARLKMTQQNIRNVVVIGQSIHESHYIDIAQARITGYEGAVWATENSNWQSLVEMIADADWMQKDFPMLVTQRENFIKQNTKYNGLLSFAQSITLTLKLWMNTKNRDGSIHSVIVDASGSFSVKSGICLSLPVLFENGQIIVLKPTPYSQADLDTNFITNSHVSKIISEIIKETEQYMSDRFIEDTYLHLKTPRNTPQSETNQEKEAAKQEEGEQDSKKLEEDENENEGRIKVTNKGELHVDFKETIVHEINMNYDEKNDDEYDEEEA